MIFCIRDFISADEIRTIKEKLGSLMWRDGAATAGWNARLVKKNQQATPSDVTADDIVSSVKAKALKHPLFVAAARPKSFGPIMVNRYASNMGYGSHIDDALMGGIRTDVSFTLFLDDPNSYEGGELVLEETSGELAYKLDAGSLILYPSTSLHRVATVTSGERRAIVGWAQSFVRAPERRQVLFDIEQARTAMFNQSGKTPEFDLLSKSLSNLLRMWADA